MLWTAPELLRVCSNPNEVGSGTKLGDVYSYGIIITEMCTHDFPFYFELQILSVDELLRLLKNLHDPANRGIKKLLETHNYNTSYPIRPSVVISDLPRMYSERKGIQHLVTVTCSEESEDRPTFKGILLKLKEFIDIKFGLVHNLIYMLENYTNHLEEILSRKLKQVETEKNKTAELISRLLPQEIVEHCVVSGLPEANLDHYEQIAVLALHILSIVCSYTIPHMPHNKLQIRIGIHTGKEGFGQVLPSATPYGSPKSWLSDGSVFSDNPERPDSQGIVWPSQLAGLTKHQAKSRKN
uniref:guanylate cyclase n=1 Tax=Strigamia maritima TaxID=126957 RepID=T1JJJ2_STRMM